MDELNHRTAIEINRIARNIFMARQRGDNEYRTSETTPPKYALSFEVTRIQLADKFVWEARNTDPAATWVEFGAHAGGRTLVLRYRPYRLALQAVRGG